MSYYAPKAPEFAFHEGKRILMIPKESQKTIDDLELFSVQAGDKILVDNHVDLSKNIRPTLEKLAKIIGIPGANKMKRPQLLDVITSHIVFE